MALINAKSPLIFTCRKMSVNVGLMPSTPATVCGLLKPIRPVSGNGLMEMMVAPFAFAFRNAESMRGWLVPGFCPRIMITSAW
ncbi:hypothetical protein D3C87_1920400 [compost metagenome]